MSPLAPPESGNQSFNRKPDVNQHNLIERDPNEKFTYSMGALYGMRHRDRRAPNLGNRFLLESISRSSDAILSVHSAGGTFSQSITSSTMDRLQRDRRQLNQNRPAAVPPRHNRNASSDGQTRYRDERQRQSNHDRGLRANDMSSSVQIRLSIKTDVKLREAENAWKPSFLQKNVASNDSDDAAELYKQVRLILNKLTAQNFGIMSEQFHNLKIDTKEKLVAVIDLVFNKAVNEPNFSEGYAKLCQYLSHCSRQIDSASPNEQAYFKRTLINKCQFEFERHVANKNTTEAALAPLLEKMKLCAKNADTNGVGEVKAQIAEEESILRRRLVSTVRFIGELYKLDMLTTNIMNKCISMLIREATASGSPSNSNQANEKLECLCKLLTTVGRKLECKTTATATTTANTPSGKVNMQQHLDLTSYMHQLKAIADGKTRNFKPSTRIKYMIMDVIELRNNKWAPKITNAILHQKQMASY